MSRQAPDESPGSGRGYAPLAMDARPTDSDRCTLAPGVPDLAALGAWTPGDLLGGGARPATWIRAEVLSESPASVRLRLPLPGTPDTAGRVHERPRGAGTGHVWLERFGPGTGWSELLAARFTAPRSASVAERRWNLYCHLRGAGVATPEPLAVGARGRGPLARRSFLVVREPERGLPLREWFAAAGELARRRRGLEALGAALARLLVSGAVLPDLAPEHVRVVEADAGAGGGDCAARSLAAPGAERGRARRQLPEILVVDVVGGRLRADWRRTERRNLLGRFAESLLRESCTWREAARLLLHARVMRTELRGDWRALRARWAGGHG